MSDLLRPGLGYAGLELDRGPGRWTEEPAEAARTPGARIVAFAQDRPVLRTGPAGASDPLFGADELESFGGFEPIATLGLDGGAPVVAARLAAGEESLQAHGLMAADLRALAAEAALPPHLLALLGYAKSMASWHATHRFCANCGAETNPVAGGARRACPACGRIHFPRVDPVVIMLVRRGSECLLARQPRFPAGLWSCLAGYVEPGETIEEAVRRETAEESGVRIGRVAYALSQPWPFPSQLMIGVEAEALSEEITPDPGEIEAARWFSRDEAALMLNRRHPDGWFCPPPAAIAHHLIRRFVDGEAALS